MNDTYVLLIPPFLLIVNQFNFEEIVTANKSKCTFHDDRISLKGISNKSKKCKRVEETLKYEKYHRGYIFSHQRLCINGRSIDLHWDDEHDRTWNCINDYHANSSWRSYSVELLQVFPSHINFVLFLKVENVPLYDWNDRKQFKWRFFVIEKLFVAYKNTKVQFLRFSWRKKIVKWDDKSAFNYV